MKHRDRYDTNIDTSAGDFKKTEPRRSWITINKYSYFRYKK